MSMLSFLRSLFEVQKCYSCKKEGRFFCAACRDRLSLYEPYCYFCKRRSESFQLHESCSQHFPFLERVIVVTHYRQRGVSRALKDAKYYHKRVVYDELLDIGREILSRELGEEKELLLCPVPMHPLRRLKRGGNHSVYIAKALGKSLGKPVNTSLIKKSRYTGQQSKLGVQSRHTNVESSFGLTRNIRHIPQNMTICLVDDIVSSGATLSACAKVLSERGYRVIACILASD